MTRVVVNAITCDCLDKSEPPLEPGEIYIPCFVCMSPEARREFIEYMEPRFGEAAVAEKLEAVSTAKWALVALIIVAALSAVAKIA